MPDIDIKGTAVALNAANLWIEDIKNEAVDLEIGTHEIEAALFMALSAMFQNEHPKIRTEFENYITNAEDVVVLYVLCRDICNMLMYMIATTDIRYVMVPEKDYKTWKSEEC